MSIYDSFGCSIAGMREAQRILDMCSAFVANPANWTGGEGHPETAPESGMSFAQYLDQANGTKYGTSNPGSDSGALSGNKALAGLGTGMSMDGAPTDIMDAITKALIAQRMYEANARLFSIQNKVLGVLIHIGEEVYRDD